MGVCASGRDNSADLSTAILKTKASDPYSRHGHAYFDMLTTEDTRKDSGEYHKNEYHFPAYSLYCVRWEWEPWLLLTLKNNAFDIWFPLDTLQSSLIPAEVPKSERFCRVYDQNPFCRMMVKYYYPSKAHNEAHSYIYQEFTFDKHGEIAFIEVWTYPESALRNGGTQGYLKENHADPIVASDCFDNKLLDDEKHKDFCWPMQDMARLSTRIPGLGSDSGQPLVVLGNAFVGDQLHPEMIKAINNAKDEHLQRFATHYSAPFAKQLLDEQKLAAKDPVRSAYLKEMEPSLKSKFVMLSKENQSWINATDYFDSLLDYSIHCVCVPIYLCIYLCMYDYSVHVCMYVANRGPSLTEHTWCWLVQATTEAVFEFIFIFVF